MAAQLLIWMLCSNWYLADGFYLNATAQQSWSPWLFAHIDCSLWHSCQGQSRFWLLLFGAKAVGPLHRYKSMQPHQCQSYFECWLLCYGIYWHCAKAIPLSCCSHTTIVRGFLIVIALRLFAAIVLRLPHGMYWCHFLTSCLCCWLPMCLCRCNHYVPYLIMSTGQDL